MDESFIEEACDFLEELCGNSEPSSNINSDEDIDTSCDFISRNDIYRLIDLFDFHPEQKTCDDETNNLWDGIKQRSIPMMHIIKGLSASMNKKGRKGIEASTAYLLIMNYPSCPLYSIFHPLSFSSFLQCIRRNSDSNASLTNNKNSSIANNNDSGNDRKEKMQKKQTRNGNSGKETRRRKDRSSINDSLSLEEDMEGGRGGEGEGGGEDDDDNDDNNNNRKKIEIKDVLYLLGRFLDAMSLHDHVNLMKEMIEILVEVLHHSFQTMLSNKEINKTNKKIINGNVSSSSTTCDCVFKILLQLIKPSHGPSFNTSLTILHQLASLLLRSQLHPSFKNSILNFICKDMKHAHADSAKATSALVRYLSIQSPEKTDARIATVDIITTFLQSLDENEWIRFSSFLFRLSNNDKPRHRLLAVDLASSMIEKNKNSFCKYDSSNQHEHKHDHDHWMHNDMNDNDNDKNVPNNEKNDDSKDYIHDDDNDNDDDDDDKRSKSSNLNDNSYNDKDWEIVCLHVIIQRGNDKIPTNRARAISNFGQLLETFDKNVQKKKIILNILGLKNSSVNVDSSHPLLPLLNYQEMFSMLRDRCMDERPIVRKSSLTLISKFCRFLNSSPSEEFVRLLGSACADSLTSVRSAALTALSELCEHFSNDKLLIKEWLNSSLPLLHDNEISIQEKCIHSFHSLIVHPLSSFSSVDFSSPLALSDKSNKSKKSRKISKSQTSSECKQSSFRFNFSATKSQTKSKKRNGERMNGIEKDNDDDDDIDNDFDDNYNSNDDCFDKKNDGDIDEYDKNNDDDDDDDDDDNVKEKSMNIEVNKNENHIISNDINTIHTYHNHNINKIFKKMMKRKEKLSQLFDMIGKDNISWMHAIGNDDAYNTYIHNAIISLHAKNKIQSSLCMSIQNMIMSIESVSMLQMLIKHDHVSFDMFKNGMYMDMKDEFSEYIDKEMNVLRCLWFLLSKLSKYYYKSINIHFFLSKWRRIGEINKTILSNEAFCLGKIEIMDIICHVAPRLSAQSAADLAEQLLENLKSFTLSSAEISAHIQSLMTLCYKKVNINDSEAKSVIATWMSDILYTATSALSDHILSGSSPVLSESSALDSDTSLLYLDDESVLQSLVFTCGEVALYQNDVALTLPEKTVFLIQMLLGPYIPTVGGNERPELCHVSPSVRATAWISLGKFCLVDYDLAKKCVPFFVQELKKCPLKSVRNNIIFVLCDLCIRYTSIIDKHILTISMFMRDINEVIREHTFVLLAGLLQRDYIKWRGPMFMRFLSTLVDESASIRSLSEYLFSNIITAKAPLLGYNNFIECIFFLNGCKFGTPNFKNYKNDHLVFSIRGNSPINIQKRVYIYKSLLKKMKIEHKLSIPSKICIEIFLPILENKMDIQNEKERKCVLQDALLIIGCKEVKMSKNEKQEDENGEEDENEVKQSQSQSQKDKVHSLDAAKTKIVSLIVKKNFVENTIPILIELKRYLEETKSSLQGALMNCLCSLFKEFKNEIDELLIADRQLAAELAYDIRKHEQEQARKSIISATQSFAQPFDVDSSDTFLTPVKPSEPSRRLTEPRNRFQEPRSNSMFKSKSKSTLKNMDVDMDFTNDDNGDEGIDILKEKEEENHEQADRLGSGLGLESNEPTGTFSPVISTSDLLAEEVKEIHEKKHKDDVDDAGVASKVNANQRKSNIPDLPRSFMKKNSKKKMNEGMVFSSPLSASLFPSPLQKMNGLDSFQILNTAKSLGNANGDMADPLARAAAHVAAEMNAMSALKGLEKSKAMAVNPGGMSVPKLCPSSVKKMKEDRLGCRLGLERRRMSFTSAGLENDLCENFKGIQCVEEGEGTGKKEKEEKEREKDDDSMSLDCAISMPVNEVDKNVDKIMMIMDDENDDCGKKINGRDSSDVHFLVEKKREEEMEDAYLKKKKKKGGKRKKQRNVNKK